MVLWKRELRVVASAWSYLPAVVNEPIRKVVFNTPTNDLHAVTAKVAAALVHIHTMLVGQEVIVDVEASLQYEALL